MIRLFTDYEGNQWPYSKLNISFLVDRVNYTQIKELKFPPHSRRMQPPLFIPKGRCRCHIPNDSKYFNLEIALHSMYIKNQVVMALDTSNYSFLYRAPLCCYDDAVHIGKYKDKILILLNFPIDSTHNVFAIKRLHKSNDLVDFIVVTSTHLFVVQEQDIDEAIEKEELAINGTFYTNLPTFDVQE